MSRKTYYQTGTFRPEHRLPSVYDGVAKKQQQKRKLAKLAKQTKQEQLAGPPLPDHPDYHREYVVPPTPGFGFEPEPLPLNDPDWFIGNDEFIQVPYDPMDVDEPNVSVDDSNPFHFNQQKFVSQLDLQPSRYFQRDPIDAFLDPYSEPEYYVEESF